MTSIQKKNGQELQERASIMLFSWKEKDKHSAEIALIQPIIIDPRHRLKWLEMQPVSHTHVKWSSVIILWNCQEEYQLLVIQAILKEVWDQRKFIWHKGQHIRILSRLSS